ncbi:MAG: M28 family peptidase [SAR202 cluster bacterium]|nr:M28 family peptidase [SAR202 cluster bacterium]
MRLPYFRYLIAVAAVFLIAACDSGAANPAATPTAAETGPAAAKVDGTTATRSSKSPATPAATLPTATPTTAATLPNATPTPPATSAPVATVSAGAGPTVIPRSPRELAGPLAEAAWANLVELTDRHSPRASATDEELAAAEVIAERLRGIGYDAALEPFTFEHLTLEKPVLQVNSPIEQKLVSFPMVRSGEGSATGTLVDIGTARTTDILAGGIAGKIALAQRGTLTFEEKAANAAAAGAAAIIIYNNAEGYFGGTLANEAGIPVVSISREDGERLRGMIFSGQTVTATVTVEMVQLISRNAIAEKPGTDPNRGVVILGGHFDTVPKVPGANDNGSGIATLLAIAEEISGRSYPFTVRLVAFGSEELGLYGSKHHVAAMSEDERARVVAMMNFDALGTGPTTGILGDARLLEMTGAVADANGIDASVRMSLPAGTSSDHASFIEANIPAVFFLGDDFSRIHTPNDRTEFVRRELMGNAAALGIGLLEALAERRD